MRRAWRSRTLRILGVGALAMGAGLVVVSPAEAAPVADATALRAAVTDLNGEGPAAEIELVPGTTYSLPGDAGCDDEDDNKSGDLDIRRSQPLKIFAPAGQAPAVLDMTCDPAKTPDRVIHVRAPERASAVGKLTLSNVVIKNGHAPNGPALGRNLGGGVLSGGDVDLLNVRFENNTAGDGGPGDAGGGNGRAGGSGGAVAAFGVLSIDGSTFTGNRAGAGGAGLGLADGKCTGAAGGHGGIGGHGGAAFSLGGLTITNSTFSGNSSGNGGDGGAGACGAIADGQAGGAGGDGGPSGPGGAALCGGFVAANNDLQPIPCSGRMTVRGSTFDGNTTGNGGAGGAGGKGGLGAAGGNGGDGGSFELNGLGGAMVFIGRSAETTLLVENSTIDGNSSGTGGAGGNGGPGGDQPPTGAPAGNGGNAGDGGRGGTAGAIVAGFTDDDIKAEVAQLVHVTITENGGGGGGGQPGQAGPAGSGGGGDAVVAAAAPGQAGEAGDSGGGSVGIFGVWASVSTVIGTTAASTDGPDCFTPAKRSEFSRSTDADVCGFADGSTLAFDTFGLGALASNGGPTRTRLPAATSSLVDKVTGVNGQLASDQRGVGRPQAAGADIGAVELQLIDMVVTKSASATSVPAGTAVTFTITAKNVGTSSPQPGVTVDDPNCSAVSAASGDANTNDTLDPGETFSYTCTATPTEVGTFTNTATVKITDGAGGEISRTASVDVEVTAAAGTPPLAKTGANNPAPELLTGVGLLAGGVVLVLLGRPRRIKTQPSTR
ncbi:MAG TPA: choice-of-anchor Q domain-containing protein [Actinophytocola sp.]|uniref:choice-of-anchor Q domain-containing protein n=1 Tax=Actinophytocola sp. TaxID=1872138 RepID=UPI002DDD15E0|nr:choice-of-anchor Q domain-containing protein [Actinophytocola sp.]HEV2780258.1 choice-of-anchor Q domain-containing protein [Actinophytocola sp.]